VTAAPAAGAGRRPVVVTACPDGPVLVRGADVVQDQDGTSHVVTRPVVAVCTCRRSGRMPWCDGTHKAVERAKRRKEQQQDG